MLRLCVYRNKLCNTDDGIGGLARPCQATSEGHQTRGAPGAEGILPVKYSGISHKRFSLAHLSRSTENSSHCILRCRLHCACKPMTSRRNVGWNAKRYTNRMCIFTPPSTSGFCLSIFVICMFKQRALSKWSTHKRSLHERSLPLTHK